MQKLQAYQGTPGPHEDGLDRDIEYDSWLDQVWRSCLACSSFQPNGPCLLGILQLSTLD